MTPPQATPVVVLTGGIGSGKSTVAHQLETLGVPVVDADALVHELTGPQGEALADLKLLFGEGSICPSQGLDRAKVRQAVFAKPSLRQRLEAILHPRVQALARQRLTEAQGPYSVYVVPLWTETHRQTPRPEWVWKVIVVDIEEPHQRARVLQRTAMPEATLEGILAAQATRTERLSLADHVITNNDGQEDLAKQVQALHEQLLKQLKNENQRTLRSPSVN